MEFTIKNIVYFMIINNIFFFCNIFFISVKCILKCMYMCGYVKLQREVEARNKFKSHQYLNTM